MSDLCIVNRSSCSRREVEQAQDRTLCFPCAFLQAHRYLPPRQRDQPYQEPAVTCRLVHCDHRYFICVLMHYSTIRRRSRRPRSSTFRCPRHTGCERRAERSQALVQDLDSGSDVRNSTRFRLTMWGAGCERYGQFDSCSRPFASDTIVSFDAFSVS